MANMFHKPAHKDIKNPSGQSQDKTLNEYIKRKQEAYGIPVSQRNIEQVGAKLPERQLQPLNRAKKMTFDDWWIKEDPPGDMEYWCKVAWKAAQENIETSAKPPVSREYTQAEIESWNAQGGSFTQEEKDNTGWK